MVADQHKTAPARTGPIGQPQGYWNDGRELCRLSYFVDQNALERPARPKQFPASGDQLRENNVCLL